MPRQMFSGLPGMIVEDKDFEAWRNPHVLSVNGKTDRITDEDLLTVVERFGIGTGKRAFREVREVLGK